MPEYREIADETFAEAGEVIRSALGTGPRPAVEVMPGFEGMVAASAVALAEGAPNAFFKGHASTPVDYLTEGREEWRHMHAAVARAIDVERARDGSFETTGDVMRHMVGDVLMQAEARDLVLAATNSDEAFRTGMSSSLRSTADYLRDDPEALADARLQSLGAYDRLPNFARSDISSAISNGNMLTAPVDDRLQRFERLVDKEMDSAHGRERFAERALGDLHDFGKPVFPTVLTEHVAHASALVAGEAKPWSAAEQGVVAHAALVERGDVERRPGSETILAYAREIAVGMAPGSGYETPANSAARIEADMRLTRHYVDQDARKEAAEWSSDTSSLSAQIAEGVERSSLTAENQAEVYTQINSLERVPSLTALSLAVAAEDVAKGDLLIGRARELAERKVTFENVERTSRVEEAARDMFLPGDAVRLDPTRRIVDFDHETAKAKLGEDPLIVTKSVVEGVDIPNGMGGTAKGMRLSYEVGGVQGRFPAQAFQHEHGESHEYGVLMMEKEKLWFVPMDGRSETAQAVGTAREVSAAKESSHVGSLETMRDMVRDGPAAGEFVTVPEAFGRKEGPVELVGSPWMSNASPDEIAVARSAIREASGPEVSPAMAAVRQASAGMAR